MKIVRGNTFKKALMVLENEFRETVQLKNKNKKKQTKIPSTK